jgi:hypothetical protein
MMRNESGNERSKRDGNNLLQRSSFCLRNFDPLESWGDTIPHSARVSSLPKFQYERVTPDVDVGRAGCRFTTQEAHNPEKDEVDVEE